MLVCFVGMRSYQYGVTKIKSKFTRARLGIFRFEVCCVCETLHLHLHSAGVL
jgi:hypothetical protein